MRACSSAWMVSIAKRYQAHILLFYNLGDAAGKSKTR